MSYVQYTAPTHLASYIIPDEQYANDSTLIHLTSHTHSYIPDEYTSTHLTSYIDAAPTHLTPYVTPDEQNSPTRLTSYNDTTPTHLTPYVEQNPTRLMSY